MRSILAWTAITCSVITVPYSMAQEFPAGPVSTKASGDSSIATHLTTFIVRRGNQLFDGDQAFRFLSFNIPELVLREEPYWGLNHPFEQADALQTIRAFGGRVTRCYVMSVAGPGSPEPRHVRGPRQYDERVFQSMDRVLAECHRAKVRLVVPFLDNWKWWGGIEEFAALRGKSAKDFYTDPQLKEDYRDLVRFVLHRRNTITGLFYKNDPAILAWETGNELREAPVEWTLEIAKFIKSIDTNHLVIDGNDHTIYPEILASQDIDMVVKHYYRGTESENGIVDYEERFRADMAAFGDKKPLLIGEFGFAKTDELLRFANAVVDSQAVGAMIWSLRQHEYQGGFRWHVEGNSGYAAYHWPGFPSGDAYDESNLLRGYHAAAMRIQRQAVAPPAIPAVPTMLPIETVYDIRWRGSVGATGYDVQRSLNAVDWTTIATDVPDSVNAPENVVICRAVDPMDGKPRRIRQHVFMQDLQTQVGKKYYYRARANNPSGSSPWSEPAEVVVKKQSGFENVDLRDRSIAPSFQVDCRGNINSLLLAAQTPSTPDAVTLLVSEDGIDFAPHAHDYFAAPAGGTAFFLAQPLPANIKHVRITTNESDPEKQRCWLRLQYGFGNYAVPAPDRPRGP